MPVLSPTMCSRGANRGGESASSGSTAHRRGCERSLDQSGHHRYNRVILRHMKTAISLPDETFDRVERAARELGVSRSEFFVRAAERWLNALDDEETTEVIDRVIAGLPDDHAFTNAAAAALLVDRR